MDEDGQLVLGESIELIRQLSALAEPRADVPSATSFETWGQGFKAAGCVGAIPSLQEIPRIRTSHE